MKKLFLLVVLISLTAFVSSMASVSAKTKTFFTVYDIVYEVSVVDNARLDEGVLNYILVAEGSGWTDLNPSDPGINNVEFQQGFELTLFFIPEVGDEVLIEFQGKTRGNFKIVDAQTDPWGFKGRVTGSGRCSGNCGPGTNFILRIEANTVKGGKIIQELTGSFNPQTGEVKNLQGSAMFTINSTRFEPYKN